MDDCPVCGTLDERGFHAPLCPRARELGLPTRDGTEIPQEPPDDTQEEVLEPDMATEAVITGGALRGASLHVRAQDGLWAVEFPDESVAVWEPDGGVVVLLLSLREAARRYGEFAPVPVLTESLRDALRDFLGE